MLKGSELQRKKIYLTTKQRLADMITQNAVETAQEKWGSGVVKIGSLKDNRSACEEYTSAFLDERYNLSLIHI